MTVVQTIQDSIIAAYESISLPNGLGTPTVAKHEPEGSLNSSDLPYVVVTRGIMLNSRHFATGRRMQTREYIVDVYCYVREESDPVNETQRDNTSDCIDTIEAAFEHYTIEWYHEINADTGDTELFARDDTTNYIGVRLRHQVQYIQEF